MEPTKEKALEPGSNTGQSCSDHSKDTISAKQLQELNPIIEPLKQPVPFLGIINEVYSEWLKKLADAYIDPTTEIPAPPVCLKLNDAIICTLGNFSMIIGKAKSRKTFFITIALAAATGNDVVLSKFIGSLPGNQRYVIYFDTEQSRYHAQRTVKRVCKLIGVYHPDNFIAYGLRKYNAVERLKMIEAALYTTKNIGFAVIDGARDIVTSINNEDQASDVTSLLLKWTEELNIHIIVVLHENKNDKNPRGHLGTELTNKAETVLSVSKNETDDNISIVQAEYCRDRDPEPFAFEINDEGLPQIAENFEIRTNKKITPGSIPPHTHNTVLRAIFGNNKQLGHSEFIASLKFEFEQIGQAIGDNKAKDFINHYVKKGDVIISGTPKTKNCKYQRQNREISNYDTD